MSRERPGRLVGRLPGPSLFAKATWLMGNTAMAGMTEDLHRHVTICCLCWHPATTKKSFLEFSLEEKVFGRKIWICVVKEQDGLVIESKAAVCSELSCLWISFAGRRRVLALYGKLLTGKQICFSLDLLRLCCQYLCDAMWLYGAQDEMRSSENEKFWSWKLPECLVEAAGCDDWTRGPCWGWHKLHRLDWVLRYEYTTCVLILTTGALILLVRHMCKVFKKKLKKDPSLEVCALSCNCKSHNC